MKRWLRQSPLVTPEVTFARQQASTSEQRDWIVKDVRLAIIPLICLQHMLDIVGMGDKVPVDGGYGPQANDITELLASSHVESERVLLTFAHVTKQEMTAKDGRSVRSDAAGCSAHLVPYNPVHRRLLPNAKGKRRRAFCGVRLHRRVRLALTVLNNNMVQC
jgi:hypothetical protein